MAGLPVVEGEAAPDQARESQVIEDIKQLVQEQGDEGKQVFALMIKAWKQGNIVVPGSLRPSAVHQPSAVSSMVLCACRCSARDWPLISALTDCHLDGANVQSFGVVVCSLTAHTGRRRLAVWFVARGSV